MKARTIGLISLASSSTPNLTAIIWLLFCSSLWAHRDSESTRGRFTRADGVELAIVWHCTDGIVMADPVSIHFRGAVGHDIARTDYASDVIVRPVSPSELQLFQFGTWLWPIATRIQTFDGYSLTETRSVHLRMLSRFLHLWSRWRVYTVALAIEGVFFAAWHLKRSLPRGSWLSSIWWVFRVFDDVKFCVVMVIAFWILPISPLIFLSLILLTLTLYASLRQLCRRDGVA